MLLWTDRDPIPRALDGHQSHRGVASTPLSFQKSTYSEWAKIIFRARELLPKIHRFYSKRAAQLKNLLKKDVRTDHGTALIGRVSKSFEDLKRAVIDDPVLQLPDYTKPFEVHTDASDYAIGGVLV